MENIYSNIKNILNEYFFIKPMSGGLKKTFIKDFGLTSLEFVELVVYVENNFKIQLPDNELSEIETIKQMADCVERNLVYQK